MIKKLILSILSFLLLFSYISCSPKTDTTTTKLSEKTDMKPETVPNKISIPTVEDLYKNQLFIDLYTKYMNKLPEDTKKLADLFFFEQTPIIFDIWLSMLEGDMFSNERLESLFINITNTVDIKVEMKLAEDSKKEKKTTEPKNNVIQSTKTEKTASCHFCGKVDVMSNLGHIHGIGYFTHSYCMENLNYCKNCGVKDILMNDNDGNLICNDCEALSQKLCINCNKNNPGKYHSEICNSCYLKDFPLCSYCKIPVNQNADNTGKNHYDCAYGHTYTYSETCNLNHGCK